MTFCPGRLNTKIVHPTSKVVLTKGLFSGNFAKLNQQEIRMSRQARPEEQLAAARAAAKMHTDIVPFYDLTQWGVRLDDGTVLSFAQLAAERGVAIDAVVRVDGGFYEHRGARVGPNNREATGGWEQTATVVMPEDQIGIIALVVDTSGNRPRFLIEFREEAFAFGLPGNIVASASAVCSFSNRTGAHGYAGDATYLAILDSLMERARAPSKGDMMRFVKSNEVIVLEWCVQPDKRFPNLDAKYYAWCTRQEVENLVSQGLASIHLLEALAVYDLKCGV